jgi:hypothetical protein
MKNYLLLTPFLILALQSCQNENTNQALALKSKELELKERELNLKEKEFTESQLHCSSESILHIYSN